MRSRFLSLGPAVVVFALAACAAPPAADDVEVTADELAAMAVPGVDESALDRGVDPCADFYAFACGGYVASLPADTRDEVRAFTQLAKAQRAILDRISVELRTEPKTATEKKAGAFVDSCLRASDPGNVRVSAFIADFRHRIEAATTPEEIARVLARMHRRGQDPFFAFSPQIDTEQLGRRGSAALVPAGFDSYTWYDTPEERIATLVGAILAGEPALGADEATRIATTAVSIEAQLYQAVAGLDPTELPHPIGRAGLAVAVPSIAWDAYFDELGRHDPGNFDVNGLAFFATVGEIFRSATIAELQAYLTARWFEGLAKQLAAIPDAREDYCRTQLATGMSDVIEPRFLALAGVDAKAKAKAKALFDAVLRSFEDGLGEPSSFLDVPTRVEALTKLGKVRAAVAESPRKNLDDFEDLVIDAADPFVLNLLRLRERAFSRSIAQMGKPLPLLHVDLPAPLVNATYDTALNKINIPGGILGGYFFSPAAPPLANFSALGAVLGHELTHGFDNHGRHVDGDGVVRDWWTPSSTQEFQRRAQCLIAQYAAYPAPDVIDPTTHAPAHMDGRITLAENIADNGGVRTAYRASKVDTMTSPMRSGMTPQQQFFVGYAQLQCAKTAPDVAALHLRSDVHAPPRARVNIPLQNFDAFAAAFQCAPKAPMAPEDRCIVW